MTLITVYKIRHDSAFDGDVEILVNDAVMSPIPPGHTRQSPHPIPEGHYAVMRNGWNYVNGAAPEAPDIATPAKWAEVRDERNERIAATDYIIMRALDQGQSVPADWAVYRQALRDVPNTQTDPFNIVWPPTPA